HTADGVPGRAIEEIAPADAAVHIAVIEFEQFGMKIPGGQSAHGGFLSSGWMASLSDRSLAQSLESPVQERIRGRKVPSGRKVKGPFPPAALPGGVAFQALLAQQALANTGKPSYAAGRPAAGGRSSNQPRAARKTTHDHSRRLRRT